jgi:ABC-type multidrug transport system ATPase subunit
MTDPLVVTGLSYLYPNGRGIQDLGFSAPAGEVLCIWGSNGSGKTTLMKVITTLYRPQKGSVQINGFDSVRQKDRARRSFFPVFDESAHIGHALGAENIAFFLELYGSAAHDRVDHIGHHFGLDLGLPVDEYSLGMKRKLVLAESLLSGKNLLLFDEPTLGLDSASRSAFFRFAGELADQGTAVVFGTNRKEEATKADRILYLEKGTISPDPPWRDPAGMIELTIQMEEDELTEYVLTPEEIPDVIARILPSGIPREIRIKCRDEGDLVWTDAALEKAARAPPMVRRMVISVVERYARDKGYRRITPEVVEEAKLRFEPR